MRRRQGWGTWGVAAVAAALTLAGCGSSGSSGSSGSTGAASTGTGSGGSSAAATTASSGGSAGASAVAASPVRSEESGLLASAKAVASALTSANAAAGGGTGAKACSAFSAAEVAAYVGVDLAEPQVNGPLGTQCQWVAADPADAGSSAEVQIVGLDFWESHSEVTVAGVAGDSFVGESLGGWQAGAKDGDTQVVVVSVAGPKASKETASEFLKIALARL